MPYIEPIISDPAFHIVLLAIVIGGLARGFSGFGAGMIIAPIAAALFGPKTAVIMLIVLDSWPAIIPAIQVRKKVQWREVLPVMAGFVLLLPVGIIFIKTGSSIHLRWFMSTIILTSVLVLWAGWQYRGPRNFPISASVGALCGFLGGSIQIPGPPAIVYWMATRTGAGIVRANIMMLFVMTEIVSMGGFFLSGLFSKNAVIMGLVGTPFYFASVMTGSRLFSSASEDTYRKIAFVLILCSSLLSLPILDQFLR